MIISEKQIIQLIKWCRCYRDICRQMEWDDDGMRITALLQKIENQQSKELKVIE